MDRICKPSDCTSVDHFKQCYYRILFSFNYHNRSFSWSERSLSVTEYAVANKFVAERVPLDAETFRSLQYFGSSPCRWTVEAAMYLLLKDNIAPDDPELMAAFSFLWVQRRIPTESINQILDEIPSFIDIETITPWIVQAYDLLHELQDKVVIIGIHDKNRQLVSHYHFNEYYAWREVLTSTGMKGRWDLHRAGYRSIKRRVNISDLDQYNMVEEYATQLEAISTKKIEMSEFVRSSV